jgi:hypothetical protein
VEWDRSKREMARLRDQATRQQTPEERLDVKEEQPDVKERPRVWVVWEGDSASVVEAVGLGRLREVEEEVVKQVLRLDRLREVEEAEAARDSDLCELVPVVVGHRLHLQHTVHCVWVCLGVCVCVCARVCVCACVCA